MTIIEARRRFPALVGYVFRACLPARRLAVLALPCAAAVLFGLLAHAVDEPDARAFLGVAQVGIVGLVLPLGTLVIGDAVLGAEVRSGTLPFTWLTPTRFGEIIVARWLGGWLLALVTLVPSAAVAAFVAGVPEGAAPLALAVGAASAGHIALFVMIGAVTRRAAAWSLGVVFLVERLLGAALSGIAQLSPTWLAQQIYAEYGPDAEDYLRSGVPHGADAVVRLGIVTVVCLLVATYGLRRLTLTGTRD